MSGIYTGVAGKLRCLGLSLHVLSVQEISYFLCLLTIVAWQMTLKLSGLTNNNYLSQCSGLTTGLLCWILTHVCSYLQLEGWLAWKVQGNLTHLLGNRCWVLSGFLSCPSTHGLSFSNRQHQLPWLLVSEQHPTMAKVGATTPGKARLQNTQYYFCLFIIQRKSQDQRNNLLIRETAKYCGHAYLLLLFHMWNLRYELLFF